MLLSNWLQLHATYKRPPTRAIVEDVSEWHLDENENWMATF